MPPAPSRVAFSYERVSSGGQVEGAGLSRQSDAFLPFCTRHRLTPSPDTWSDAGTSAFKGKHRKNGAMARFLQAARDGLIPAGSVLVVEDQDRFSRESASYAEELLLEFFRLNLALGIVADDLVVDRALYDSSLEIRLRLTLRRESANEYSRKLSKRIKDVWERRRAAAADGVVYPAARPFWCDWDGTAFTLNHHAPVLARMVQLSIGGYGVTRIASMLNAEGILNGEGRPWTYAWVRRLLVDRRLIGEQTWSTGDVIAGHFPPVVSRADFDRCQAAIRQRDGKRGRHGKGDHVHNILQGVLRCRCGALLTHSSVRGRGGGKRDYAYLRCVAKTRGTCTAGRWMPRYDEDWLLNTFMRLRWGDYFRTSDDSTQRIAIEAQLRQAEGDHAKQQQAVVQAEANLRSMLTSGTLEPATATLLGEVVQAARDAATAAQAVVVRLQRDLDALLVQPDGATVVRSIQERVAAFLAGDRFDVNERRRFNNWVGMLGVSVELWPREGMPPEMVVIDHDAGMVELVADDEKLIALLNAAGVEDGGDAGEAIAAGFKKLREEQSMP